MRPRRSNAGFSLVEVMIAILVLGVGLLGLTQGLTTALQASKDSEVQTAAALIAAGQIETLRAEGGLIAGTREGKASESQSNYKWKEVVRKADVDGLYEVQVSVEDAANGKELYDLKTLLFDAPLSSSSDKADERKRGKSGGSRKRKGRSE